MWRSLSPEKPLHIAASLRIVARHEHMPRITVEAARDVIQRAARDKSRSHGDQLMVDDLERAAKLGPRFVRALSVSLSELDPPVLRWSPTTPTGYVTSGESDRSRRIVER